MRFISFVNDVNILGGSYNVKKQYLKERCLFYASGKIHWICSFICEPNIAMCGKFLIKLSSVCMYLEKLKFPLLESTECLMY